MKIIDISWPITPDITGYKNKKEVVFCPTRSFEQDNIRESKLIIGAHTGTHVDAPSHMLANGLTIDSFSVDQLVGTALVIDFSGLEHSITNIELQDLPITKNLIVLFKTDNSEIIETAPFDSRFVYLSKSGAQLCADKKVKAVGIDYLGIERNQPGHETHKILLNNNIPIIEGLRLAQVQMGYYFLVCLPLNIEGLEASPARAILFEET